MKERYPEMRWRVLALCFGMAFLVVFLRLGWVQVVRADHWKAQARLSSTETETVHAERGRILDRRGQVLVQTEILATVGVADPRGWLRTEYPARVAGLVGLSEKEVRGRLRGRTGHTVIVRDAALDGPTRYELSTIPNMSVDLKTRRSRPHGRLAHQLLGNVSEAGEGISGLERLYDEVLAGRDGRALVRQDATERPLARVLLQEPQDGADVTTTLDLRVQSILQPKLDEALASSGANAAQGIVMDVKTGEVIALAQAPYDTPAPDGRHNMDRWRVMAATDEFEPGSSFKIFTYATLLSESVADSSTVFDGMGREGDRRVVHRFPNNRKIRDVHPVGRVSLRHAFTTSSNIIFVKAVEERLKRVEMDTAIRNFGFTRMLGTGFIGEADGFLEDRSQWGSYKMQSLAMGQAISVTLLQLASASAAVMGDGNLRTPMFVREISGADGVVQTFEPTIRRRNLVSERTREKLRAAGRDAVHESYGTGESARVEGLEVAGKTGTAQVSDGKVYVSGIYAPSFVGAVPAHDPRLLVIVILHGAPGESTYGGNTAAPCAGEVVREIAARTPWLEDAFEVQPFTAAETVPAPSLVGLSAAEIERLSQGSAWRVDVAQVDASLRAVGQVPRAGIPMRPGSRVQVAWAGGRR